MADTYPFAFGYCAVSDVTARIKQGQYNPDAPGEVGSAFLEQFITQSAAQMDMVLARVGYTVPLVAQQGMAIAPQVWSLLLFINATGAAALVEMWRHSEDASSEDRQAERLMTLFDDMLARVETGADNLALFGVDGPFEPEADPSLSMDNSAGDLDPNSGLAPLPLFTVSGTSNGLVSTSLPSLTQW